MRKSSRMMSGLYDQENCTFPSQMTLQFQAIRSACRIQRNYWIGAFVCGIFHHWKGRVYEVYRVH